MWTEHRVGKLFRESGKACYSVVDQAADLGAANEKEPQELSWTSLAAPVVA
jgi:hypothetical protein